MGPQHITLPLVLAGLLAVGWAVRRLPPKQRRQLVLVLAVAFGARLIFTLVLHATGAWQITGRGAVTPDEATIDLAARLLAAGDERTPLVLGGSLHTSWLLVSWSMYDLLWNDLLAMKLLNVLLGSALVVPMYELARHVGGDRVALTTAWLVALFPNAIVWSGLALRESLLALLIAVVLAAAVRPVAATWSGVLGHVLATSTALVLVAFTRSYMLPLLLLVYVLSQVLRRRALGVAAASAVVVVSLLATAILPTGVTLLRSTVALVAEPAGSIYNPFSDCTEAQECEAIADPRAAGGSAQTLPGAALKQPAAPEGADPDDLSSSLQSVQQKGLVRALAIAVLAGRPVWRTEEFFLLLQPGVMVWWALLPFAAAGTVTLIQRRRWNALPATAGFSAAVIIFLAYSGQFIRHHYMLEPVGLFLAALGVQSVRKRADMLARPLLAYAVLGASALLGIAACVSVLASLWQS